MELSKKDIDFLVSILKKYIDTSLATITNRGRIKVHHFEEQYMRTVNGGLPLDQSLFRTYLQTCGKVNVWIDSDKTGELPTDGDQDVLYFLWVDGSYVMYIYTNTYVLITTTTQIDDLNVSGATTYSSQKIVSLIVTTCLGMSYSNLISGLQSTNAQGAIDELKFLIDAIEHDDTLNKNINADFLHITQAEKDDFVTAFDFVEDFISNATAITREELLVLINNNELIPSSSYRITDYTTTTVQADTISAGHDFDIIVTALSTNELSENAKCVRKSDDIVEKIGIEKSLNLIDEAELVLLILDASCPLSEEDKYLLEKTKDKKRIIIMNKIDLKLNNSYMDDVIKISAKNNEGIEDIKDAIKELFNVGTFMSKNLTFFTNVRQISLLKSAIKSLEDVQQGIKEEREIDMIEIDLKLVWEKLGDIIGANYTEELIDNLFSRFCLGK